MVGLGLSLAALVASLIIFCYFRYVVQNILFKRNKFNFLSKIYRNLRNNRTRIHKNLFIAMIIQVVIRLTVYLDQAIIRKKNIYGNETRHGIDNTVGVY